MVTSLKFRVRMMQECKSSNFNIFEVGQIKFKVDHVINNEGLFIVVSCM